MILLEYVLSQPNFQTGLIMLGSIDRVCFDKDIVATEDYKLGPVFFDGKAEEKLTISNENSLVNSALKER